MPGTTIQQLQDLLATPQPPELGPGPRSGVLPESAINQELDDLFDLGEIASANQPLLRSLVLLWHDHLDGSHVIAQSIESADGSFLHGIMHRREPDYGNAKYWFHRVGAHPAFPEIATRVSSIPPGSSDSSATAKLIARGRWDPFAFIDACEQAARFECGSPLTHLLRQIQKIESDVLLAQFVGETQEI